MSKEISISVIIPVYNTSSFLRECLDAIIKQSFRDFEVIIVNDASTDNSQEIIDEYCSRLPEIRCIQHAENKGLPSARNSGVKEAMGKYVVHLDSDDYWTSEHSLRRLFDTAEADQCEILRFNGVKRSESFMEDIFSDEECINVSLHDSPHLWHFRGVYLFFFRRDFLDQQAICFDPTLSIGEDAVFLSAILPRSNKISTLSEFFYNYRVSDESMMQQKWEFEKFLEEQNSAFVVSENLRHNPAIWMDFWQFRLGHYWPRRILKRAIDQLEHDQVVQLIDEMKRYLTASEKEAILIQPDTSIVAKWLLLKTGEKHINSTLKNIKSLKTNKIHLYVRLKDLIKRTEPLYKLGKQFLVLFSFSREIFRLWRILLTQKPARSCLHISNREGLDQFNIQINRFSKVNGVSAMIRVKNEAEIIQACLQSIEEIFDELVIIDNNSSDNTLSIINTFKANSPNGHKVKVYSYPYSIARCGSEHQSTPHDSVHSLSYYYNWCLSQCHHKAVFKWDADMIMTSDPQRIRNMKEYLNRFSRGQNRYGTIPIQTVYIDVDGGKHFSKSEINEEVRIFKNSPANHYVKGELWEVLLLGKGVNVKLDQVHVYELKDIRKNEFSNWSEISFGAGRKVLEFRNYHKIQKSWYRTDPHLFESVEVL